MKSRMGNDGETGNVIKDGNSVRRRERLRCRRRWKNQLRKRRREQW